MDQTEISCTVTEEGLTATGEVGRRAVYKDASVSLGRDSASVVVLRVSHVKNSVHVLQDFKVYRRFINEGKATISFSRSRLNIMLSNCPPGCLAGFLKTMALKIAAQTPRKKKPLSIVNSFEKISPITNKDYERAESKLSKQQPSVCTPTRGKKEHNAKRKAPEQVGKDNAKLVCRRPTEAEERERVRRTLLKRSVQLSTEQEFALKSVTSGKNIFLTGGAGTGKSFLLRRIVAALPPDSTFVTASTGVAAYLIGGSTLHSFGGIGSDQATLEQSVARASRPVHAARWRRCQHLVVDEISMVEADYFDRLEAVARAVRGKKEPFGGIQLILTGDFFQLPPVSKPGTPVKFCFMVSVHECFEHVCIRLLSTIQNPSC